MKKIKIHNIDNHPTIDFELLKPLQDDYKDRTPEQIEKLANRIKEVGFKYDFFVFKDKTGDFYILVAHGRQEALQSLKSEGYEIPPVPYTQIFAKNIEEAKKEILYLNSNYGTINPNSDFVAENLDFDADLSIEIPDLDIEDIRLSEGFGEDFSLPDGDKEPFQQMTFTLADAQSEQIKSAITT